MYLAWRYIRYLLLNSRDECLSLSLQIPSYRINLIFELVRVLTSSDKFFARQEAMIQATMKNAGQTFLIQILKNSITREHIITFIKSYYIWYYGCYKKWKLNSHKK